MPVRTAAERWTRRVRTSLFVSSILLAAACASSRNGTDLAADEAEAAPGGDVTVVVDNDLLPTSSVSVWMVLESGRQVLLGSVGPGHRDELEYSFPAGVATFRLRARPIGGREIISNGFSLYDGARVHWALRANVAVVVDGSR
jgi:hypothetical protein